MSSECHKQLMCYDCRRYTTMNVVPYRLEKVFPPYVDEKRRHAPSFTLFNVHQLKAEVATEWVHSEIMHVAILSFCEAMISSPCSFRLLFQKQFFVFIVYYIASWHQTKSSIYSITMTFNETFSFQR